MFFWTPYTFVRIVFFFIAGILFGIYQAGLIPERVAFYLFMGFMLLYFLLVFSGQKKINTGFVGLIAVVLAGYLNTIYKTDSLNGNHFLHFPSAIEQYKVVITDHAEAKTKSWKTEARVQAVFDGNIWHRQTGKVLLYFSKQDFEKPFRYGDELVVKGSPQELQPPANPGEFDYKKFLTYRKIYHQHFLRKESVHYLANNPPWKIINYSIQARVWAEAVLTEHIQNQRERAVAFALILGVKDGLDNDLVHAYASSGAMHVLAVSGLHVGIIYLIMMTLFKPLKSMKHSKWVLALASFIILWSYAFITGLSPSVLRAVTMFSFLSFARPLNYHTNIFNTLAISAFCLLMWEPYMLMSVGFQLSFMAVIGIVYIQPKLYQLWEPDNLVIDKIWQITCVSLAAQLATFALGLLYFHQFPAYFLVSNLFVIPGALISLCLGIGLLATSWMPPLATLLGLILEGTLGIMNYLVFWVEQLPYSLVDNIYITTLQSWLLLGMVISIVLLAEYRKFSFVVSLFLCGSLYGGIQGQHHFQNTVNPKFVVYQVNGHSVMEWIESGRAYMFTDTMLLADRERIRFHIRPNRLMSGVYDIRTNNHSLFTDREGLRLFAWHNMTVLQLTGNTFKLPDQLEVDYLVISNNAVKYMDRLLSVKFKLLIVDSSNSWYTATRILQEAAGAGVDVHSVLHDGAFITEL
jgi:competence protein ComEC